MFWKVFGVRRINLWFILCSFIVSSYFLYFLLESSANDRSQIEKNHDLQLTVDEVKLKLVVLEDKAKKNDQLLNAIQQKLYIKFKNTPLFHPRPLPKDGIEQSKALSKNISSSSVGDQLATGGVCVSSANLVSSNVQSEIQMLNAYEVLKFNNVDNGAAWKQGWSITYDKQKVEKELPQLQVFLVPHSHTDPGWIKTFENYYVEQTSQILSSMLSMLSNNTRAKFIYAEMSFFERWWQTIGQSERAEVKRILQNNQFEIVTGAWVQCDEANSHYFSIVDQMVEGHQWLMNQLDYKPKNHWSIDPFGLSPTVSHLVRMSGMENMAIQRVHYEVKKYLALKKNLEFYWRQLWNSDANADPFVHLFPFYSYDIPHTCGPDPKICCQFDFTRTIDGMFVCPWNVPAQLINSNNVAFRAQTLLDQYRKHAQLYKTNVLLVPLGDDFRYTSAQEWHLQYDNYAMLFDYMNDQKGWNVKAQFGTLQDYFAAVSSRKDELHVQFPTLTGDFFTYADRDHDYWSGYFTSQPFYKRMERTLAHYLRGAEIAYSLIWSRVDNGTLKYSSFPAVDLFNDLILSRRNLALFQHHDGITGTAKDFVMADYGERMKSSIEKCKKVIASSVLFLMSNAPPLIEDLKVATLDFSDVVIGSENVVEQVIINIPLTGLRTIVLYNSLPYGRSEMVCVHTDMGNLEIFDSDSRLVEIQISPLVKHSSRGFVISSTVFEVCWLASVASLAMVTFEAKASASGRMSGASTLYMNDANNLQDKFVVKDRPNGDFEINGFFYTAKFSGKNGMLKTLTIDAGEEVHFNLELVAYKAGQHTFGGAYLFLPEGPAEPLDKPSKILHVDGELYGTVYVSYAQVLHSVQVIKRKASAAQSLLIKNSIDIGRESSDFELSMRIKSQVRNANGEFFTDLNGYQLIKRKYFSKLPLQGNFYPMPSSAYIEDDHYRVTILSGQPGGCTSLNTGIIEVILDRRTHTDDNRGVQQPLMNNIPFIDRFKLLLEKRSGFPDAKTDSKMGFLSMVAYHQSMALLYPYFTLYNGDGFDADFRGYANLMSRQLPCDYHLVNLRTVENAADYNSRIYAGTPKRQSLMIVHRTAVTCDFNSASLTTCESGDQNGFNPFQLYDKRVEASVETTLTAMHHVQELNPDDLLQLSPMDIKAYLINWL